MTISNTKANLAEAVGSLGARHKSHDGDLFFLCTLLHQELRIQCTESVLEQIAEIMLRTAFVRG